MNRRQPERKSDGRSMPHSLSSGSASEQDAKEQGADLRHGRSGDQPTVQVFEMADTEAVGLYDATLVHTLPPTKEAGKATTDHWVPIPVIVHVVLVNIKDIVHF